MWKCYSGPLDTFHVTMLKLVTNKFRKKGVYCTSCFVIDEFILVLHANICRFPGMIKQVCSNTAIYLHCITSSRGNTIICYTMLLVLFQDTLNMLYKHP